VAPTFTGSHGLVHAPPPDPEGADPDPGVAPLADVTAPQAANAKITTTLNGMENNLLAFITASINDHTNRHLSDNWQYNTD
jgi:hypothetical protein